MVKVKQDLSGKRYGQLTVMYQAQDRINRNGKHNAVWHCKCDCGKEVEYLGASLKNGRAHSCGCIKAEKLREMGKSKKKSNIYDLTGEYGIGYDPKRTWCFYFDKEDYELIKNYYWKKGRGGYVETRGEDNRSLIQLHRLIMHKNLTQGLVVDHINQIKVDNRKNNLRICTHAQNHYNVGVVSKNTSGATGVSYKNNTKKWRAFITVNKKAIELGVFDSFEEALKARKKAEKKYCSGFSYDESQAKATYPNKNPTIAVSPQYIDMLACLGIVLQEEYGYSSNEKYGQLPLLIEKITNRLSSSYKETPWIDEIIKKYSDLGCSTEILASLVSELTGITVVADKHE